MPPGLLERDELIAALDDRIATVRAGSEGTFVWLGGEAGVGKTALLTAARGPRRLKAELSGPELAPGDTARVRESVPYNSHRATVAARSRARAPESWREAASILARWQAFLEAGRNKRHAWAFASDVAVLDAEAAAVAGWPRWRRAASRERGPYGTSPSSLFRGHRRGTQLHPRRGTLVGRAARALVRGAALEAELGVQQFEHPARAVDLTQPPAGATMSPDYVLRDATEMVSGARYGIRNEQCHLGY